MHTGSKAFLKVEGAGGGCVIEAPRSKICAPGTKKLRLCGSDSLAPTFTGSYRLLHALTGSYSLLQPLTRSYRLLHALTGSYELLQPVRACKNR